MEEEKNETTAEGSEQPVSAHVAPPQPVVLKPIASVRPRRSRKLIAGAVITIIFCFLAGLGGSILALQLADNGNLGGGSSIQYAKDDGNKMVTKDEQTIASVVATVSPSVVSIVTTTSSRQSAYAEQAAGTGMIVTKDGYIMTNKHVVRGAQKVSVITSEGKTYDDVSIVGTDPLNDIAFLKIKDVSNLPAVTLGDSKTVRTGQNVIAIGNALGQYQNTVTSGIISGLGRPVVASDGASSSESLSDLLQTDAAINAGNSGGPLLNSAGQVIGINTAVAQDAQSIGFSIPIGAAKGVLSHLVKTGKLERAFIGVQYISITPEVQARYKLGVSQGDYIKTDSGSAIRKDSPADIAGLKDDDIIVKVNDQAVEAGKGVSTLIGEYEPGDTVQLTLLRDGKTITKDVKLAAY